MAQNFMTCQFCETSNETKWKCINCDLILCQECKIKLHTKVKKNENHEVVDLKEISNLGASETIRNLDLKDIQCTNHHKEQCIIYCQDCKVLSCAECLLESHQHHKLEKIDEVYSQRIKRLQELDQKISHNLPYFEKYEKDLQEIKSDEYTEYKEIKQKISKQETKMKERITKQKENLDKLWIPRETEISVQLADIKHNCSDFRNKKDEIQEALQSHNASITFNTAVKLGIDIPDKPGDKLSKQQIILSQTKDEKTGMDSLVTVPMLKIVETYISDIGSFNKVKKLANGINVMCSFNYRNIQTFTLNDNKSISANVEMEIGATIIDMTVTDHNKLLFTTYQNSDIKCLSTFTPDSAMKVFISISPFNARGIHATSTTVLIGFMDTGTFSPLTEDSRRGIVIYDYNCKHVRTIERDQNNQFLFTLPETITTNTNGDICVVDSTDCDTWEGRVVVLGEWGNFKWAYDGHPSINTKCEFQPADLVATSKGLILVTDKNSNAVHILSMGGEFVTSLNESHGIVKPYCLSLDHKGQLQICCECRGKEDNTPSLHIVYITF